jgi:hypothetical protein
MTAVTTTRYSYESRHLVVPHLTHVANFDVGHACWFQLSFVASIGYLPFPTFSTTPAHSCPRMSPSFSSNAYDPVSIVIKIGKYLSLVQVQVGSAHGSARHFDQRIFRLGNVWNFVILDSDVVLAMPLAISLFS